MIRLIQYELAFILGIICMGLVMLILAIIIEVLKNG